MTSGLNENEQQAKLVGLVFKRLITQKLASDGCYENFFDDHKGNTPIFTSKKALVSHCMKDILNEKATFSESKDIL